MTLFRERPFKRSLEGVIYSLKFPSRLKMAIFPQTSFQEWFHSPDQQAIDPTFTYDLLRVGWNNNQITLTEGAEGTKEITFLLDPQGGSLLNTTLIFQTPLVESQNKDLLVAWPDNFFHNYIQKATLRSGSTLLSEMDSTYFDAAIQLLPRNLGPGKRDQYLRNIGNLPSLTKFQKTLPSTRLSFSVPWGWSEKHPLPISLMNVKPLTMTYTLRPFSELLRVVERISGTEKLRKYQVNDPIQIGKSPQRLQMLTDVALFTPEELAAQRSERRYFILDWIESFDIGSSSTIRPKYPVRALLLLAENQKATLMNNLSVYGTDPEDGYLGKGPLLTIQDYPAEIFSDDQPLERAFASPERPGYYFIPLVSDLKRYESPGIVDTIPISTKLISPEYNLKIRSWGYVVWILENGEVKNAFL